MTGLAPTEEPIGRHHSCETLANPRLHSNVAHLYHGATSFPDATYLWCLRGELEGAFRRTLKSVSGGARATLQIWDYHQAQELKSESEVFVRCFAASDVEETLATTRDTLVKIANLALNCCWQPRNSGGLKFSFWIILDVLLRPGGRVTEQPMDPNIQGSFLFNNSLNQFPSDLKAPVCQYSVPNSFYKLNPGLNSQLPAGTPHGISDILSRSMVGMGSTGTTTTLLSGYSTMTGFGPSVTSTSMYYNRDYNSNLGGFSKPGAECPMKGRGVSCWAESSCDWRGARQQCTNSESASRNMDITSSQRLSQSTWTLVMELCLLDKLSLTIKI